MNIECKQEGLTVFVAMSGRLDILTSRDLQEAVAKSLEGDARHLVFDFSGVEYVSSSGLRVLLQARKALKVRGGTVVLAALNDFVREVIASTGFDSIFPIAETTDHARGIVAQATG